MPKPADQGQYIASESSFYRVLHEHDQVQYRGSTRAPRPTRPPATHIIDGPNRVWTWDVT